MGGWFCDEGPTDLCVSSGVTAEETAYASPSESRAGGLGDAVSLRAAGSPHQGTDAAGRMHHLHQSDSVGLGSHTGPMFCVLNMLENM